MKASPYQTKPGSTYQLSSIERALKLAAIEGGLIPARTVTGAELNFWMVTSENTEVPTFAHPVPFNVFGQDTVVIDCRGTFNSRNGFKVTNTTEYEFQVLRGALTLLALTEGLEDLVNVGDLAMTTFARFLGENITRRLAFNPEEQMLITMVSAFYFMCMSRPAGEIDEREMQKMVVKVSRCTRLNAQWIFENNTEIRHMENIQDYIDVLKAVIPNRRMDTLNLALLYGIVGGGWFGLNARELMAVSLEHLPTWIAMVYKAVNDRSYRKAGISMVVQQADRNGEGKTLSRNVVRLIGAQLND